MQDTWTDDAGRISVDERQDCDEFDVARFHEGGTALTFTRKFDTCDDERDYLIQVNMISCCFIESNILIMVCEVKRSNL